jgi:hypothetical protein
VADLLPWKNTDMWTEDLKSDGRMRDLRGGSTIRDSRMMLCRECQLTALNGFFPEFWLAIELNSLDVADKEDTVGVEVRRGEER